MPLRPMPANHSGHRVDAELTRRMPVSDDAFTGTVDSPKFNALLTRILDTDYSQSAATLREELPESTRSRRPDTSSAATRASRAHRRGRRGRVLWLSGVFTAAVAALIVIALLPAATPIHAVRSPAWRLVSSLGTVYAIDASAGATQAVTCPTTPTCYVETDSSTSELPTGVEVTHDGGTRWDALPVPSGIFITTALTCPSAASCMASAISSSTFSAGTPSVPMMLSTNDGGATWSMESVSIPADPGPDPGLVSADRNRGFGQLTCFTSLTCIAFGTTPYGLLEGGGGHTPVMQTVVLRTHDGGAHWSIHDLPWVPTPSGGRAWSNAEPATFSCPNASTCVGLAGVLSAPATGHQATSLLEWRTENGGTTWTHSWVASFSGMGGAGASVTCADTSHCLAFTGPATPTTHGPGYEMLSTNDGGVTWSTSEPLAGTGVTVTSVSCRNAADCWIAGGHNEKGEPEVGVIMATTDGGSTWTSQSAPKTLSVGDVACPSNTCYAVAIKSGGGLVPFRREFLKD